MHSKGEDDSATGDLGDSGFGATAGGVRLVGEGDFVAVNGIDLGATAGGLDLGRGGWLFAV